jgi:hypothetical protein
VFYKTGPENHFWHISHTPKGATLKAIDIDANELDSFFIPLGNDQIFSSQEEALKKLGEFKI